MMNVLKLTAIGGKVWQKNPRSFIRVYFNDDLNVTGNEKLWFDTEDNEFHSIGMTNEKHDEIVSQIIEKYNNYNVEKYQAFVTKIDDTNYKISFNKNGKTKEISTCLDCVLGEIVTYFNYMRDEMFFVHVNDIELGEKLYNEYQKNDFPATEFMLNNMILKHTAINNLRLVNMVVVVD